MANRTPLYQNHLDLNAKMVDFGGWDMPIQYSSIMEEHDHTRTACGIFDVSHMTVVDIQGPAANAFLLKLVANDVNKLKVAGKALYTCMLNEQGGIIDDLIVYYMRDDWYRLVVNAATRDKDIAWITAQAVDFDVNVQEQPELAMIAVQGPTSADLLLPLLDGEADSIKSLKPFNAVQLTINDSAWFVARTGYTGEDGFEIILPAEKAPALWQDLLAAGAAPIGLGARDTLRLEAGMNLYGHDMDETTSPWVSGLGWTVSMEHDFTGKAALEAEKAAGPTHKLIGLVLEDRGVLRDHYKVITPQGEGEITSGGFSPTMKKSIAFARVPVGSNAEDSTKVGDIVQVEVRNKALNARVVKLPFVRNGAILV